MTHREIELRSEYESTYLHYALLNKNNKEPMSFKEWKAQTYPKKFKSTNKTK